MVTASQGSPSLGTGDLNEGLIHRNLVQGPLDKRKHHLRCCFYLCIGGEVEQEPPHLLMLSENS